MTTSIIRPIVLNRKNASQTIMIGIYSGLVALFVCLIGMVETFGERDIIGGIISMGHTMLIVIAMGGGALAVNKLRESTYVSPGKEKHIPLLAGILVGIATGLIVGAMLAFFAIAAELIDMRTVFINVSPGLLEMLTLQKPASQVTFTIMVLGTVMGGLGASIFQIPPRIRMPLVLGLSSVVSLGMLRDMAKIILSREGWPSILLRS